VFQHKFSSKKDWIDKEPENLHHLARAGRRIAMIVARRNNGAFTTASYRTGKETMKNKK